MHTNRACWSISLALLLLLIFPSFSAGETRETKRVLVLQSEEKDSPGPEMAERGIRGVFRSNKLFDAQLYIEYLDMSRFGDLSHARAMADFLRRKYSGVKIDVVITVYPSALDFLLAGKRALFPGVPVIAALITGSQKEDLKDSPARSYVTGTISGDNLTVFVDTALRLRPDTKHVALVSGTAPTDVLTEEAYRTALMRYPGRIDLIDLTKLSMEETLSRVSSLPPGTLVFCSSIFRDGAGKDFVPYEAVSLVSRVSNAPVFGFYETYLGFGIVGGRLMSFKEHGREAAALALRVMAGESPGAIPFGGEQAYVSAYDWRELKRWGISEKVLPPGSIVEFKPASIWQEYWWVILAGIFFMLIETVLIMGLFINLHKRRQADEMARRSQDALRELAGKLLTVQETERRRLARELHDDLSQKLVALSLEAGFIKRDSPSMSQAAGAAVHRVAEGLVDLSASVHDISRRLHPSILEDLGLADAIRSECDSLCRREQMEAHFEAKDIPAHIPLSTSLCLYRVTQESLTNILKHARATQIHVSLTGEKDLICLLVKDNGKGFTPMEAPGKPGLGLVSMRERVRLIRGEITIESQPGQGTTIEVKAPFKEAMEGREDGSEVSL